MKNSQQLKKVILNQKYIIIILLLIIVLFFGVTSENFFSVYNLMNILRQSSIVAILAIGQTFVIISGGIDLSVSAIVSLAGTIAALVMSKFGVGSGLGIMTGISIGGILGLLNGFIITKAKVPPIIATLGVMSIANGSALAFTQGYSVMGIPESFNWIGRGNLGPIPVPVIIMLVLYIIGYLLLSRNIFGAYTYGVGGNEEATKLSGVSVEKIKLGVYTLSGITASIGGLILTSRLNSGQPTSGAGLELSSIAAVVIGGASVTGGAGGVWGSLIGAIIMSVLTNGFDLLGVGRFYQMIFTGIVLIIAVSFQRKKNTRLA